MQIIIISGMSGAGKSYALQALEDTGYYCVDNLPAQLVEALLKTPQIAQQERVAIGIDIRGGKDNLKNIPNIIANVRQHYPDTHLVYLYARHSVLLKRYNESRRSHPLVSEEKALDKAIRLEAQLLEQLAEQADWRVDTSSSNIYELACLLRQRLVSDQPRTFSLMFRSFGFKHEAPSDSDFIFDVRCLPNPYWVPELRMLTGRDSAIINWLQQYDRVEAMYQAIRDFLIFWLQDLDTCQRTYVTVSIGCTGGRHRSVYMTERLYHHFRQTMGDEVLIYHREAIAND